MTEYDLFDQKLFPNHLIESQILNKIISTMGLRGAKPQYFKPENGAFALPVVSPEVMDANPNDFGLRLYALYLSNSIVVLLNGGIKTVSYSAQRCPNLQNYFNQAVAVERKIRKGIEEGYIVLNALNLEIDDGFTLDI